MDFKEKIVSFKEKLSFKNKKAFEEKLNFCTTLCTIKLPMEFDFVGGKKFKDFDFLYENSLNLIQNFLEYVDDYSKGKSLKKEFLNTGVYKNLDYIKFKKMVSQRTFGKENSFNPISLFQSGIEEILSNDDKFLKNLSIYFSKNYFLNYLIKTDDKYDFFYNFSKENIRKNIEISRDCTLSLLSLKHKNEKYALRNFLKDASKIDFFEKDEDEKYFLNLQKNYLEEHLSKIDSRLVPEVTSDYLLDHFSKNKLEGCGLLKALVYDNLPKDVIINNIISKDNLSLARIYKEKYEEKIY